MIGIRKIGNPGNEGNINFQPIDTPPRKVEPLSKSNPIRPAGRKPGSPEIIKGSGGDTAEISPEARKLSEKVKPKQDNQN